MLKNPWFLIENVKNASVHNRAVESESRSRKDFEPEESESQKILTTPTPGWLFARRLWLFVPQMFASVTLGNLSSLTFQQKMIMAIQKGCSTLSRMPTLRGDSRSPATLGLITQLMLSEFDLSSLRHWSFHLLSFWLALSSLCDVSYATMNNQEVLMRTPLSCIARHRAMITPVSPVRTRLFHISPIPGLFIVRLKLFSNGDRPLDWNSNVVCKSIASKNIQSDMN